MARQRAGKAPSEAAKMESNLKREESEESEDDGSHFLVKQHRRVRRRKHRTVHVTKGVHPVLPRLSLLHIFMLAAMFVVLLLGSYVLPMIDRETLKPSPAFPKWLKTISFYSNIPIKLGVVHAFLYGCELYFDPKSAERHIGQRLTTMCIQFFQHHRWGQHLHMQVETAMQVTDIFQREAVGMVNPYPRALRWVFAIIALTMAFTNFVTSCCYHTLEEQLVGAFFTAIKLIGFDYLEPLEDWNIIVGSVYTRVKSLILSALCTGSLVLVSRSLLAPYPSVLSLLMHPTTLAVLVFSFCLGFSVFLKERSRT